MPRREQKAQLKGHVSLDVHAKFLQAAKEEGISASQLVCKAVQEYLDRRNPAKGPEYTVGSRVDRKTADIWGYEETALFVSKLHRRDYVEDRSAFVAHGLIWIAVKQSNGTANHYEATYELNPILDRLFKEVLKDHLKNVKSLVKATKALQPILDHPAFQSLTEEKQYKCYKSAYMDYVNGFTDLTLTMESLDDMLPSVDPPEPIVEPEPTPLPGPLPVADPAPVIRAEPVYPVQPNVATKIKNLAKAFNLEHQQVRGLEVGAMIPVEGGYVIRSKESCYEYRLEPALV